MLCEIFIPLGVTSWLKIRAASSCCSGDKAASARSRCASTIREGPPSASSVCEAQHARSLAALDLPEPLHDELEIGRLDPSLRRSALRDALPSPCLYHRSGPDTVEDGLDELWLESDSFLRGNQLVELLHRPLDRPAARGPR